MKQSTPPESSVKPGIPQQSITPELASSLPRTVVIWLAVAIAICSLVAHQMNQPDIWRGLTAAACVTVLEAIVSVRLLVRAMLGDAEKAIRAFMVASAVRMIISVGGCLTLVLAMGYPLQSTMIFMLALYLVVLIAETVAMFGILNRTNH